MRTILVLNGPNLNLLGRRQPEIYGRQTLDDVAQMCAAVCPDGFEVRMAHSNHEGTLIDLIQEARRDAAGLVINPGGYSHTSIALMDALHAFEGPKVEVHVSNIHARESFRHHSYVSLAVNGVIAGLGVAGYVAAVRHVCTLLGAEVNA